MYRLVFYIGLLLLMLLEWSCHSEQGNQSLKTSAQSESNINLALPPYNCDNTGKVDCSDAIIRAFDDVLRPTLERQRYIEQILAENPDTVIGFEILKERGVIFPDRLESTKFLYLPKGVYKVSKTLSYTFKNLKNTPGSELNRQIHLYGDGVDQTIIRLVNDAPGFDEDKAKPVVSFMQGNWSNVSMSNTIENLTIEVGSGNPSAVGLNFMSANSGAVRNVSIRSLDPEGKGLVGLQINHPVYNGYVKNLIVDGFEVGIEMNDYGMFSVFEFIKLQNQQKYGIIVDQNMASIRKLESNNKVPALLCKGQGVHVVLIESKLKGIDTEASAIINEGGIFFGRDIDSDGYQTVYQSDEQIIKDAGISEFCSHEVMSVFDSDKKTLHLPVEETPPIEDHYMHPEVWACVNDFGAKNDGSEDASEAIQRAIDSGAKVIWFEPGQYLIDKPIEVKENIERINFMYADLAAGSSLKKQLNVGAFQVVGESNKPLLMEQIFAWEKWLGEHFLIDHASTRTLVLKDMHTQVNAIYFNSVPGGKVFIENVACTDESEKSKGFIFSGQKVWARHINPERAYPQLVNDGSDLWILGFKTEGPGTVISTVNGGRTEVLGGVLNAWMGHDPEKDIPAIYVENAQLSFTGANRAKPKPGLNYYLVIEEKQGEESRNLLYESFPKRQNFDFSIPLFVSKSIDNE